MQIKFSCKMARNDHSIIFHENTMQVNKRILQESQHRSQEEDKSKEDFQKLYTKLNQNSQKSVKEEGRLNSSWYNKNVMNYMYGPISQFPSGSWWGIRMDCSRDRVHDPFDEDLQYGPYGVTSICTSNSNVNEDVDFGDSLTLTGEKYMVETSEKDPLIKNYKNQVPVRLIRSYNLLNKFAPKTGYRYDGMYVVTDFWIGINSDSTRCYKFILVRLSDQEPPPWNSNRSLLGGSNSFSTLCTVPKTIKNCSKCPSLGTYEFKKYSHGSNDTVKKIQPNKAKEVEQVQDVETKEIPERQKNLSESSIVTRHVFKKGNASGESIIVPSTSMTEGNTLSHIGTKISKAHSTNISIRTGLYDSSHSVQQDIKRNVSQPFCRASKSVNVHKSSTENLPVSNRDKGKNADGKAQIHNEFSKHNNYSTPNMNSNLSNMKFLYQDTRKESNTPASSPSVHANCVCLMSQCKHDFHTNKSYNGMTNKIKEFNSNINLSESYEDTSKCKTSMHEEETLVNKTVPEEVQEFKSLDSLDSLTPDKILHLISKEKCHPLSKLLMGNMIGLTSEQSIALKMPNITSHLDTKDITRAQKKDIEETTEKNNFNSEDLIAPRCYKFRRRKRLSRKMMNKSDIGRCDKTSNNKLQRTSSQHVNILEENSTFVDTYNVPQTKPMKKDTTYTNKCSKNIKTTVYEQSDVHNRNVQSTRSAKKNIKAKNEIRTRLNAGKTLKSSVKRHVHKKQRREIANLLIDAKIGPKIRGPRNRRLRCMKDTRARRSYEPFSTAICTLNKCQIVSEISRQRSAFPSRNSLAKVNGYKRIRSKQSTNVKESDRLSLKRNRMHKGPGVSMDPIRKKVTSDEHKATKDLSSKNANSGNNNKGSKIVKSSVKSIQTVEVALCKNQQEKSIQAIPLELSTSGGKERNDHDKNVTKPCTTDAITQCSLIREPLSKSSRGRASAEDCNSNVREAEDDIYVKAEFSDSYDMKSEVYEAIISDDENSEDFQNPGSYTSQCCEETSKCFTRVEQNSECAKSSDVSYNSGVPSMDEQGSMSERTSAFVPVNVVDSDLRIARLRSIGFKPINLQKSSSIEEALNSEKKRKFPETSTSKVIKQDVAEKYNKYTNEEDNIVVYMDDELQYQDIEDEDEVPLPKRPRASVSQVSVLRSRQVRKENYGKESQRDSLLEEDLESPWHGWKKVVTNKDSYWVGW